MAISARTPTNVKTYYFVPTIYANRVIDAVKSELVAWEAIDGSWRTDLKKGDTLNIPVVNTVTATEVTVGTEGALLDPFNTAGVQLVINQWYEAPVAIDTMTLLQTQVDMEGLAVDQAGYSIKKRLDTSVCDLFSSLGGYSTSAYGSDGQTLSDDILIYLMETLDEADVPRDGKRTLILDPSGVADMVKIDKFIQATFVTIGAVANGVIAKGHPIYACDIRVTNNLTAATTGAYAAMLHKQAIAGAVQLMKPFQEPEPRKHRIIFQAEALWGVIEARDTFGVPFYSRKK